jgi:NAD+ kinase
VEEHAAIKLSLGDGSSGSNGSMSLRDGSKDSNGSMSLRDGSKGLNGSIGYPYALNDIAVLKRDNASMITIHARINGDELVTYQADGLVVSTPTGSTAYNLSNGGPIMAPLTGILCLTPVAPHSLNIRPIVINDDSVIELTVESRTHNYLVAVDGRSATLDERIPLVISKAPYTVRIVKRASQHYFATLREKMMWGMDAR